MEQLIKEIRAYADGRGLKPSTVLQYAGGYGAGVWAEWVSGRKTCTLRMAERIRKYMADNPPVVPEAISCPSTSIIDDINNVKGEP